jgi:hypothetical protein
MAQPSKTNAELKLLRIHLERVNDASEKGDSLAAIWLLEGRCKEFSRGEWVNVRSILANNYPHLNLESEEDVLEAVDSWISSAYVLERHFSEYAYREWQLTVIYHRV